MDIRKKIKPNFLFDATNKKTGVLLKPQDFELLVEELEYLHDTLIAYERTEKPFKTISFEEIEKKYLGK